MRLLGRSWILAAALFGALLTGGTPPARAAEPPACTGRDLFLDLQTREPGRYERLVAEGRKVANAEGLLWRIERPGLPHSFLFGTMHVTDARLVPMSGEVAAALAGSRTVALELREVAGSDAEQRALQETVVARGIRRDAQTLRQFAPADREVLVRALAQRGIAAPTAGVMEPWLLLSLISVPGCELRRAEAGLTSVDERIGEAAVRDGKPLLGLETVAEQVDSLATLQPETARRLIMGMARLGPAFEDVFETLVGLYARRETGLLFGDLSLLGVPPEDAGAFAEFFEILVERRNATMRARAVPLIEQGNAFIAVGALHLVGENGLVEMLRRDGFTVTRVW